MALLTALKPQNNTKSCKYSKFNLEAIRISGCILIHFNSYSMHDFLRIHDLEFPRACHAQSRCLPAGSLAIFFHSIKLPWSS